MKRLSLIFLFFLLFTITFSSNAQEFSINDLQIRGAKKTKTAFIKKIIATKKGATLDSLALKEDIIILKRLASVGHAYFQVFHSHENYYNVFIHIQENLTVIPEINFWTTTNKRVAYKIGLYDYNFLGRNIAFGGFYQNNGFDSYAINFRAPNIISKK